MATVQGVPKVASDPNRSATIGTLTIPDSYLQAPPPCNKDRWDILVSAAGGGTEVKVTYDAGPPLVITKVETA